MTEYWKSIGKKWCEICKTWMTNNKISIETHERSAKHKSNVERRLRDVRRSGAAKEKELEQYKLEMMKIEAAALGAFEKDISSNPKLAKEYRGSTSILDKLPTINAAGPSTSTGVSGRFGDVAGGSSESATLVRGRERALDSISKKMEKRSKWLEAKTSEGSTYYWNRDTYETVWDKPKDGYLTIEEQKTMNVNTVAPPASATHAKGGVYRHNPYGKWTSVQETTVAEEDMPDLKLPYVPGEFVEVEVPKEEPTKPKLEFQEKTVESLGKTGLASGGVKMEFKKRKANDKAKRNVRQRTDDD